MITDLGPSDHTVTSTVPGQPGTANQELNVMLLHEVLARTRMREDQRRASAARLAGRLATVRRWQRLARYAERRAHHAESRL